MQKLITTVLLFIILIFSFCSCSGNANTDVETTTTVAVTETTTVDPEDFYSEEAADIYALALESRDFPQIAEYLKSNDPEYIGSDYRWNLGEHQYLCVNSNRSLLLYTNGEESIIFENIDYPEMSGVLYHLQSTNDFWDPGYGSETHWVIGNMSYVSGSFYRYGEKLFSLEALDMDPQEIRLLGYSTSSETYDPIFIFAKYKNKIGVISVENNQFSAEIVVDDSVEELSYSRSDRFRSFYNEDAVLYGRTIVYRSNDGMLKQVDFNINGQAYTSELCSTEGLVIISNYDGPKWFPKEWLDNDTSEFNIFQDWSMLEYCIGHSGQYCPINTF